MGAGTGIVKSNRKRAFIAGLKAGVPIALGYFAVSFTFGIQATQVGLSVWQSTLISLTNLTSAGQFASLSIIAAGGSLLELALNQFIINLRYLLMGFSISQKLDRSYPVFHKFFVGFGITDEIYAVSAARPGKNSPYFHYGAMALAIPGWTIGTLVGAAAGQILPAIVMSALSVAIYGMFLAIIIPPAKKNHFLVFVILAAMVLGAVFKYVPGLNKISSGFVIIIITVLVAAFAAIIRPIRSVDDMVDAEYEATIKSSKDGGTIHGNEIVQGAQARQNGNRSLERMVGADVQGAQAQARQNGNRSLERMVGADVQGAQARQNGNRSLERMVGADVQGAQAQQTGNISAERMVGADVQGEEGKEDEHAD